MCFHCARAPRFAAHFRLCVRVCCARSLNERAGVLRALRSLLGARGRVFARADINTALWRELSDSARPFAAQLAPSGAVPAPIAPHCRCPERFCCCGSCCSRQLIVSGAGIGISYKCALESLRGQLPGEGCIFERGEAVSVCIFKVGAYRSSAGDCAAGRESFASLILLRCGVGPGGSAAQRAPARDESDR